MPSKLKMAENIHITDFMYGLRHALVSLVLPREPTSAPNKPCSTTLTYIYPYLAMFYSVNPPLS